MQRVLVVAGVCALTGLFGSTATAADVLYEPAEAWNGKRVYLSPATHNPDKQGCGDYKENAASASIAEAAANSAYADSYYVANPRDRNNLRGLGYRVRIGKGTYQSAVINSNAWNAHAHVPIHTNATTFRCTATTSVGEGTWVMHGATSTQGKALSQKILAELKTRSPGANDKTCVDTVCSIGSLHEISAPNAPSAYIEAEFHTWNKGVAWIREANVKWGYRIAVGIDNYFGKPRG